MISVKIKKESLKIRQTKNPKKKEIILPVRESCYNLSSLISSTKTGQRIEYTLQKLSRSHSYYNRHPKNEAWQSLNVQEKIRIKRFSKIEIYQQLKTVHEKSVEKGIRIDTNLTPKFIKTVGSAHGIVHSRNPLKRLRPCRVST